MNKLLKRKKYLLKRKEKNTFYFISNEKCPICNNHIAIGSKNKWCSYIKCNWKGNKI